MYHIKPNGEPGVCKAQEQSNCPYASIYDNNPSPHFRDESAAIKYSEMLFRTENEGREYAKALKKSNKVYPNMSIDRMEEIGKHILEVVGRETHFNPTSPDAKPLNSAQRILYYNTLSAFYRGITEDHLDADITFTGNKSLAKTTSGFLRNLPKGVAGLVDGLNVKMEQGKGRLIGGDALGMYSNTMKESAPVEVSQKCGSGRVPRAEFINKSPVGKFFINPNTTYGWDVVNGNTTLAFVYKKEDGKVYEYALSTSKPSGRGGDTFKKIGDDITFLDPDSGEEHSTTGMTLYQVSRKISQPGATITISNTAGVSTVRHEFTHHIQAGAARIEYLKDERGEKVLPPERLNATRKDGAPFVEAEMFNSLAQDRYYHKELGTTVYNGFPEPYMGKSSKDELFTVATERLFYPTDNFLGESRHENADKIRQWVAGYWYYLSVMGDLHLRSRAKKEQHKKG